MVLTAAACGVDRGRERTAAALDKKHAEVANEIRKVFTINFLDPNAVRTIYSSGRLNVSGEILRLPGYSSPILARTLIKLEADLTEIREVRFIRWNLDNWSNEAGQWRPTTEKKQSF